MEPPQTPSAEGLRLDYPTVAGAHPSITSSYLMLCSDEKAYEWLSRNSQASEKAEFGIWGLPRSRTEWEQILLKRESALIDLGLAQFGWTPGVLQTVFQKGNAAIRHAVLRSPFLLDISKTKLGGGHPGIVDLADIAANGDRIELETLARNPYLDNDFYLSLLRRSGPFSEIGEDRHLLALNCLGMNERMWTPFDDTFADGLGEYCYNEVFQAAWELALTAPVNRNWAFALTNLLAQALPSRFEKLTEAIERWKDASESGDTEWYQRGPFFQLRSRLADLREANKYLLGSSDLALRESFYRRFDPIRFQDWPSFYERDGENFVREALKNNDELWKQQENRKALRELCRKCPDPGSWMEMPNMYTALELKHRRIHPQWFEAEDNEYKFDYKAAARETRKLVTEIDEKVEAVSDRLTLLVQELIYERNTRRWWQRSYQQSYYPQRLTSAVGGQVPDGAEPDGVIRPATADRSPSSVGRTKALWEWMASRLGWALVWLWAVSLLLIGAIQAAAIYFGFSLPTGWRTLPPENWVKLAPLLLFCCFLAWVSTMKLARAKRTST